MRGDGVVTAWVAIVVIAAALYIAFSLLRSA